MNWMGKLDELDEQNTLWQLKETIHHLSHVIVVTTTHEQNIICGKAHLDCTTHEHTIIFRQLFACHVVGSRPVKRKTKMPTSHAHRAFTVKPLQNGHIEDRKVAIVEGCRSRGGRYGEVGL